VNSELIVTAIVETQLPSDIERDIDAAYSMLGSSHVAVRSSAPSEDSAGASWAGQLESYMNTAHQDLGINVRRCWASVFSERAMTYRQHCGMNTGSPETAVVIQRMVDSRISGTAFSAHPVTRDPTVVFIECCAGLGETLVLGMATPSSYVVDKNTGVLVRRTRGDQGTGLRRAAAGGGNETFGLTPGTDAALLSDRELEELVAVVLRIERLVGFHVDVEWAFEDSKLYILQSRPVTGRRITGVRAE
jgi:pyruvate,water dikinase